jgi:hypothetical protein
MVRKLREDSRIAAYHHFDDEELGKRAHMVYSNLGKWLGEESEGLMEDEYFRLGQRRREEGIPLSQVVIALLQTRRNLWHFVELQGWDTVFDLRQQLDLEIQVVRFFDRAIIHAVRGYEADA